MSTTKEFSEKEQEMARNLYQYFEAEKKDLKKHVGWTVWNKFTDVAGRVADALKISKRKVFRCLKNKNSNEEDKENQNPKRLGRRSIVADSFTEGVIRRKILEAYSGKSFPTLKTLHFQLQTDPNFPWMSKSTLWKIMKKQLKFKFRKFHSKPVPFERTDISAARHTYLQKVRRFRREGYEIFYQDESWCNESQSLSKGWHIPDQEVLGMGSNGIFVDVWLKGVGQRFADKLIGGVTGKPSGAGQRVIMIGIGSEKGFLGRVSKCFKGKDKKKQDYHQEMNWQHFEEWFKNVLELLPNKSVVCVDQATYHRRVTETTKNPTTQWRKATIIEWLSKKSIPLPGEYQNWNQLTVPKLRALAKENYVKPKFVLEQMVEDCGKDVNILWIPVAHCELNPIELIWSAIKRNVAANNKTFKINDVLNLSKIAMQDISPTLWSDCCRHVQDLEQIFMDKEKIMDEFFTRPINPIVIDTGVETTDDSSSDDEESDVPPEEEDE